ncbi:hypothetical protein ACFQWF_16670 [Methylorubrum suomiense]
MSIFSGKRGRQASIAASQQIQNGADTAYGYLDTAYDQSKEQFGKAATTLGDLAGGYGKASTLYQDALGVNGAAAADSARGPIPRRPATSSTSTRASRGSHEPAR